MVDLAEPEALHLLREGELDVVGRLVDASNATLYCTVSLDGATAACVHKPIAGERPLWDFPDRHARWAVRTRHVPAVDRR